MKVYNRYSAPSGVDVPGLDCSVDGEGKTRQEFKDECNINLIMARYMKSGVWPAATRIGQYGDFSGVTDYKEALDVIQRATSQFDGLPAKVRDRFKNNPAEFLDALHSGKLTLAEAHEIGILSEEGAKRFVASQTPPAPPAPEPPKAA